MRLDRLSLQPTVKGLLVPLKPKVYRRFYCVGAKQFGFRRESLSWVPASNRIYRTSSFICQHTPLGNNRRTLKLRLCFYKFVEITGHCQTISICAGNQTPLEVHAKLALSSGENGRLIIVGDVHGCVLELAQLLKKVRFNKNRDKLVFAGDLCNKGPRSQQVQTAWLAFWPSFASCSVLRASQGMACVIGVSHFAKLHNAMPACAGFTVSHGFRCNCCQGQP